jgi:two-component system, NarL family, nitrate/nitrite response regulator NarL
MTGVLIVASIRIYREGLALMLSRHPSLTVTALAPDRVSALESLTSSAPDVVLLDLSTPESDAVIRDVDRLRPRTPVVALGVVDREPDMLACIEAGIAGLVSRDASFDALVATIESAARGEVHCSPQFAGTLVRRVAALAGVREIDGAAERLTARECQIVDLLEENLSNKEIAVRLGIEVATVKNHVHNLLEKLQVQRRTDVARRLPRSRHQDPRPA